MLLLYDIYILFLGLVCISGGKGRKKESEEKNQEMGRLFVVFGNEKERVRVTERGERVVVFSFVLTRCVIYTTGC